jgi:cysteine desulfurase
MAPTLRIYLDHNASTPLDPTARQAMLAALEAYGNPSSIHAEGRAARDVIERSRRHVADLLGGRPEEIVFTSGGTEADCLGVIGLARRGRAHGRPARVLVSAIEHPAVTGAVAALVEQGFEAVWLPVDSAGRLDLDALEAACRAGAAAAAVALANHEIGTVQELGAIAALCRAHGVLLHCDAVQAAGKMPIHAPDLGADTLAMSAHKIHGPKGVGALWVRAGIELAPVIAAGHQERERRPGTENLPGIAGLGEAARLARLHGPSWAAHVRSLSEQLEAGLLAMTTAPATPGAAGAGHGVRIHGRGAPRIGNTVNAGFDGALGETVVAALDLVGFAASTGAACTSGSVEPSPVLLGLGLPPARAVEAVRFSLGRDNTAAEVHALLEVLPDILARARAFR